MILQELTSLAALSIGLLSIAGCSIPERGTGVLVDVEIDGKEYQDGGAITQLFLWSAAHRAI